MKTFFVLLVIFCSVLAGIFYYFDGFEDIQISKIKRGPFRMVYQQIDEEDSRFDYLLDNLSSYLEREKKIIPKRSFEFKGSLSKSKINQHLVGHLLENEAIQGRLRKDIKLKTIIKTDCIVGKFSYKNEISKIIFDNLKFKEFESYLDSNKIGYKQMIKIIDKQNETIEVIIPVSEWKIQ